MKDYCIDDDHDGDRYGGVDIDVGIVVSFAGGCSS